MESCLTYNLSSARHAYASKNFSSHCWLTYSLKISVVSGLYLSRPFRIVSICAGRSLHLSKAGAILGGRVRSNVGARSGAQEFRCTRCNRCLSGRWRSIEVLCDEKGA